MNCDDLAARLTEFLEGELEPEVEQEAVEHLATCGQCEMVLAETREVTRLAHEHGRPVLGDSDRRRMFDEIANRLSRPR